MGKLDCVETAIECREDLRRYVASLDQLDQLFQQPERDDQTTTMSDVPADVDESPDAKF